MENNQKKSIWEQTIKVKGKINEIEFTKQYKESMK